jgi:hypothetical protein
VCLHTLFVRMSLSIDFAQPKKTPPILSKNRYNVVLIVINTIAKIIRDYNDTIIQCIKQRQRICFGYRTFVLSRTPVCVCEGVCDRAKAGHHSAGKLKSQRSKSSGSRLPLCSFRGSNVV